MNIKEAETIIEAILFASGEPVPVDRLCAVLGIDRQTIDSVINRLADYYSFERRGISLLRLENSVQLCSRAEYSEYIRKTLETRRAPSLSQVSLEVLSIVAYRQPTTKSQIEQIRGVDSSYTVNSLAEKGLIEECGRLDVPGRPVIYRTTTDFLRCFGLSSIDELPELPDLSAEADGQLSFGDIAEGK